MATDKELVGGGKDRVPPFTLDTMAKLMDVRQALEIFSNPKNNPQPRLSKSVINLFNQANSLELGRSSMSITDVKWDGYEKVLDKAFKIFGEKKVKGQEKNIQIAYNNWYKKYGKGDFEVEPRAEF
jgi:hypothetical protein